ncbi:hypothetical protein [Thalassospira xiamenensis]|uniref:Uncharacterized protein n=1 Tax=Thalassospira xiamenensis TaxID=220697 RepID=A0A285TS00_9PROT|nr:hypothetical protein [Thalassospira xiamenensis]SOC26200.1 hypothetical protein SAMN05428964_10578 [Thalassospira xiamenensis]
MKTQSIEIPFMYLATATPPRGRKLRTYIVRDYLRVDLPRAENETDFPVSAAITTGESYNVSYRFLNGRHYMPAVNPEISHHKDLIFGGAFSEFYFRDFNLDPTLSKPWAEWEVVEEDVINAEDLLEDGYRVVDDNREDIVSRIHAAVARSVLFTVDGKVWRSDQRIAVWKRYNDRVFSDDSGHGRFLTLLNITPTHRSFSSRFGRSTKHWSGHDVTNALAGATGYIDGEFNTFLPDSFDGLNVEESFFIWGVNGMMYDWWMKDRVLPNENLHFSERAWPAFQNLEKAFTAFQDSAVLMPDPFDAVVPDDLLSAFIEFHDVVSSEPGRNSIIDACLRIHSEYIDAIQDRRAALDHTSSMAP